MLLGCFPLRLALLGRFLFIIFLRFFFHVFIIVILLNRSRLLGRAIAQLGAKLGLPGGGKRRLSFALDAKLLWWNRSAVLHVLPNFVCEASSDQRTRQC